MARSPQPAYAGLLGCPGSGSGVTLLASAWGLFGNWLKWWLLTVVTAGIYGLWVVPRMQRWIVENTGFAE